jgi:hypothetical protein
VEPLLVNPNKNSESGSEIVTLVADFMENNMSTLNTSDVTGCENSQVFKINRDDKTSVVSDISIDYTGLSEKLIAKIPHTFEGNTRGSAVIIEVGVYYPKRANADDKKDERKIIAFNLKNWQDVPNEIRVHLNTNPCDITIEN